MKNVLAFIIYKKKKKETLSKKLKILNALVHDF